MGTAVQSGAFLLKSLYCSALRLFLGPAPIGGPGSLRGPIVVNFAENAAILRGGQVQIPSPPSSQGRFDFPCELKPKTHPVARVSVKVDVRGVEEPDCGATAITDSGDSLVGHPHPGRFVLEGNAA